MSQEIQMPTPVNSLPIPGAKVVEMILHPTETFDVAITGVDDQVTGILNGKVVFIAHIYSMPLTVTINDETKNTGLNVGMNTFMLLAYNFAGPTSLNATVKGTPVSFSQAQSNSNQNRPVWYQTYNILVAAERLTVNNPSKKSVQITYGQDSDNSTPVYSVYTAKVAGTPLFTGAGSYTLPAGYSVFYIEVDHEGLSTINSEDAPEVDSVDLGSNSGDSRGVEFYYGDPQKDVRITMSIR